jgi:hypothetical protein
MKGIMKLVATLHSHHYENHKYNTTEIIFNVCILFCEL